MVIKMMFLLAVSPVLLSCCTAERIDEEMGNELSQAQVLSLFRYYDISDVAPGTEALVFPDNTIIGVLSKGKLFSIYKKAHADEAAAAYNYLISLENRGDFFQAAEHFKRILNEGLYLYAIIVAILHRPDTAHLHVPPLWQINPRGYFTAPAIYRAQLVAKQEKGESVRPETDLFTSFTTGNDLDPEFKLSWWREDIQLNAHHFHWHQVYPWKGINGQTKDREGELFYYMHQQMMARYDAERLAVGLPRVLPYGDWSLPIPDGYDSHLTNYYGTYQYSARPSGMTLADSYADDPNNPVLVSQLVYHYHKILDAINTHYFITSSGTHEPVNIVNLGAAVESSISSPNPDLYGSLHNYGHGLISIVTDPHGRYQQACGVMADPGTSIRDPIFFRWHKFIDNIFVKHKNTLKPYADEDLHFKGISVHGMTIETNHGAKDILTTRMETNEINIAEDMFSTDLDQLHQPRSKVNVDVPQGQYDEFTYQFNVTSDSPVKAAFRVFMAPKLNHYDKPLKLNDQRRLFIEMDTFVKSLKPGENLIQRSSNLSSVIKPPGMSYGEIYSLMMNMTSSDEDKWQYRDQRYSKCGWPLHMLVPRGTPAGMSFDLFVMLTDWSKDRVDTDHLDQGTSYCGVKNDKYPDQRAMGFPFDRNFNPDKTNIASLAKTFDNMMTIPITIRFGI